MSKRGDTELISDIKEAIGRIKAYLKKTSYKYFLQDIKTQDAVVRNIEIIGEAAKNISDNLKKEYGNIPWKKLAGIRDRLIHNYFGVNYDIVWIIAKEELPEILSQINKINKE
ncbi:MAG: DUF86 domain-containing protein [Nanoarchaeota archaeon]